METILVVDDEAQVRTLARDILLGAGYRVLEAEDGEQALRVAEDHQGAIHILLTDIMMPGINGKELADRFLVARPDAKAIFMSGRAAEVISDAGVLIPVDAFLAKPFTVERLLNKVRERLEYRSPLTDGLPAVPPPRRVSRRRWPPRVGRATSWCGPAVTAVKGSPTRRGACFPRERAATRSCPSFRRRRASSSWWRAAPRVA